jgi:hypothetical protein
MFLLEKPFFCCFDFWIEARKIAILEVIRSKSKSVIHRDILKWVVSSKKINIYARNQFASHIGQY